MDISRNKVFLERLIVIFSQLHTTIFGKILPHPLIGFPVMYLPLLIEEPAQKMTADGNIGNFVAVKDCMIVCLAARTLGKLPGIWID